MSVISEGELKPGDRVVYPNQGVCRVIGTTEMTIAGQVQAFIKLAREEDQATVMVPRGRVEKVGIRRVADQAEIARVFKFLAAPLEGPELDWKVRARTHGERMTEGGLLGLAQVVKGLATLADLRPLPPKERELYDNARHLLVSEIAASTSLGDVSAEDAVDLALFPPGVERKKPDLAALALAAGEDDLGLELGAEGGLGFEEEAPAEEEEAAEAEGEEEAEEAEEEAPKKRGRPPKAKAEEPAEEAPKRPRGRPRKTPAPEEEAAPAEKKPAAKKAAKVAKPKAEKAPKAAPKKAAAKPAAKPAAKTAAKKTTRKK